MSFIVPWLIGCTDGAPWASAQQIESLDQEIGGPKAAARVGDYLLENDRIRLAILGARRSFGPHISGGSLIDADLQRHDARDGSGWGYDQLAEVFPTVNLDTAIVDERGGSVEIEADGEDGGDAVIAVEGQSEGFLDLLQGLWSLVQAPTFDMRTEYRLSPGASAVQIRTTALFGAKPVDVLPAESAKDSMPVLESAVTDGVVLGDMFLPGGSVDVFVPGVGFDEESYVEELTAKGVNTFSDPIAVEFLAGTSDGVSYALAAVDGNLFVPVFTSSMTAAFGGYATGDGSVDRFPPGTAITYDRLFSVGRGDVGSALDGILEALDTPRGHVSGRVTEETTGIAMSGVHVFAYRAGADEPWNEWQTDVGLDTVPDGSFGGDLPVGDWELLVHMEGRPTGDRIPIHVSEGDSVEAALTVPRSGQVNFRVRDEMGELVPAKVSFFTTDGEDVRRTDLDDAYLAGHPADIDYAPYGEGSIVLPPGTYQAIASRGVEYELGVSDPFLVGETTSTQLDLQVVRSVDTSGWIAADFHVHSSPSHDSGVSLETRVISMAAEGVEFFSSSDHDAITDFAPTIEALDMGQWISSTVGVEVTTVEIGHFLGFPLRVDTLADHGGAFDWTGLLPREIMQGIRDLGDPRAEEPPVVFVAHPRDGILGYFDQYGLDPYVGTNRAVANPSPLNYLFNDLISPEAFSTDFDAVEILGAKSLELARTPTDRELSDYAKDPSSVSEYDILTRTMEEQKELESHEIGFAPRVHGQIDDWFALLNLGYHFTALSNSDTHDRFGVEAGCPRNYVQVDADDPWAIDPDDVARAVREGRVVLSYGPFIRFYAGDDEANGPGTTLEHVSSTTLHIHVETPTWFHTDRVELYENGELIHEWELDDNGSVVNLDTALTVTPTKDSWYVVLAAGRGDVGPVFTPVEYPRLQLQDIVLDALAQTGLDAIASYLDPPVPRPRTFPIHPLAITNPIRVDLLGDGFDPPGIPAWVQEPSDGDE
jgi:hypothetical protein